MEHYHNISSVPIFIIDIEYKQKKTIYNVIDSLFNRGATQI